MSKSTIACRDCGHTLACKHHTGNVSIEVGIRVVVLADGRVQAKCPCGSARVIVTDRAKRAA